MCLSPITIRNRSKYFSLDTLHKVEMTVPCGHCAECLAAKQNEYYFRSYYQSLETWDKGGYCLFDTLTYDDEHVPHINDYIVEEDYKFDEANNFTCFSQEDVRLFFVRLRRSLSYHGYDVKNKLKYFLCSEYGEDPRYTHRPHYHVMFYVTDSGLDPITLSKYIDKCWAKGRTDGQPYKGDFYVLHKRVFYRGADDLHMQNVCHYIGKYMVKDSEFTKVVNARIDILKKKIIAKRNTDVLKGDVNFQPGMLFDVYSKTFHGAYGVSLEDNIKAHGKSDLIDSDKKYLKDLKRHCSQFVRQSQGFGLYMIEKLGKDWIFEHNCVRMPDKDNIWKDIPIPGYIVSKLFKEKKIDNSGEVYYGWSDYGIKFRQYHELESDKAVRNKFLEIFNYSNLIARGFSEFEVEVIFDKLDKYMMDRSFEDLLFYQKYMKGRIYVPSEMDEEPDFESFYYVDQRSCIDFRYDEFNDLHVPVGNLVSREDMFEYNDDNLYMYDNYIYKDENFDRVIALYNNVNRRIAKKKQELYDFRKDYDRRMKKLGWKVPVKY